MRKSLMFILVLGSTNLIGQKCAYDNYKKVLEKKYGQTIKENYSQFEKSSNSTTGKGILTSNETITIPVVFHIIHNGENVGSDSNIYRDKLVEQIAILNKDFSNPNLFSATGFGKPTTPRFQFCLAKTDPNGNPSDGVTRSLGPDFYIIDEEFLKTYPF